MIFYHIVKIVCNIGVLTPLLVFSECIFTGEAALKHSFLDRAWGMPHAHPSFYVTATVALYLTVGLFARPDPPSRESIPQRSVLYQ